MPVKSNIQTINGAKAIIETLKKLSVDTVFGYPGGTVLDLYDELCKQSDIKHILVRHEQSAVHCAEGYARESGKCGVVFVTSGPGATNTITGIVNAYSDGYPVVILAGQTSEYLLPNAYQKADLCEMTRNCTKAGFRISDAAEIENTLIQAFNTANEGKKGPVVIELVKDIFKQQTELNNKEIQIQKNNISDNYSITDINRVKQRILGSERPLIIAGGGVHHSKAYKELEEFVQLYNLPVVTSMMGMNSFDAKSPNFFGMTGINGAKCANELVKKSDLIISLGCRFNDRITCMFKNIDLFSKITEINIVKETNSPDFIQGDIKNVLAILNENPTEKTNLKYQNWYKSCTCSDNSDKKISNMMHGFEVLQKINDYTKGKKVIFTSDVGQHQILAVKNLTPDKNRPVYVSGGFGTMGFGLPSAIGCAVAAPEATVICITGDGSFQMTLNELALCKDLGLNIKVVILNNGYLGMVRQLQEKDHAGRYSQTKISSPDFVKLAQSYGLEGIKVNTTAEIETAINTAFQKKGTFILNFEIESMEVV